MAAGHLVHRDAKTLTRDPLLEACRKEAVIAPHENTGRNARPALEGAWGCKDAGRLARLSLCEGLVDHRLRNVVKEIDERIEWSALHGVMARVRPPFAGRLAGLGNHRVDQHQHGERYLPADEGCDEARQRLRDEDHASRLAPADRTDDGRRVLGQASGVIRGRKRDRHGLVAALFELWRNPVPVPRAAVRARYENE